MKIFRKALSLIMVASMVLAMLTVAVSAAAPAAGTKYSVDLSLDKSKSDRFEFKAIRKADGKVFGVETTPKATWSPDWTGLWVDDGENAGYTVYCGENKNYPYDLMGGPKYTAVLAFKAPADGYYDVYFKGVKYQGGSEGSYIDVALTKGELAEVYASRNDVYSNDGPATVEFDVKGVNLSAGEEVWVVVYLGRKNTKNGGANFGVSAFDVTYVGTEDPGTYVPAVGTTYKLDLNMEKITSSRFYVSALKKSDNTQVKVKQTAEQTWDPAWTGFYVEGHGPGPGDPNFVIYKNEPGNAIFDQICGGDYKSVIAFKAPVDGFYDVYYAARKYQNEAASVTDVILIKKGASEPLASKLAMSAVNDVVLDAANVELKKGEELWVVYNQNEANTLPGNSNLGVTAFDVTYIGTESLAPIIPEPGDVFNIDLSMTKPTSKLFYFSSINKADGKVAELETTARKTWSDKYPGFYVSGSNNYVIYTTEKPDLFKFDQVCSSGYKSVIAFVAPVDGIYDVYYKAIKYQWVADSVTDVSLIKTGSAKALASKTAMASYNEIEFDVKKVFLSKGEEVKVVYDYNSANVAAGNSNLGLIAFDVKYVGEGEKTYAVGDLFKYDLALNQKENGQFKLAGILPDGTIDYLQGELGTAWGAWKGWKLSDGSKAVFCETQVGNPKTGGDTHGMGTRTAYIDMQPRKDVASSAIIFTAPKSGTYKFSGLFTKLKMWPGEGENRQYKVEAIVGGEVVSSYLFKGQTPAEKHEDATLGGHVVLKEGETIMFVASYVDGTGADCEIAVCDISVTLTSFGSTIPNPGTSDNVSAAIVLLVLSALGIAVVSKKRR